MKYLSKLIPDHDKLKHFYIGALVFIGLSVFLKNWLSFLILFVGVVSWEIVQKLRGGKNNKKEIILDILFSILTGVLLVLKSLIT